MYQFSGQKWWIVQMGHYVIPRKIKAKVAYEEDFLQGSPFLKGFLLPNYEFDSLYPQPHLPILQIHFMNKTFSSDSKSYWKTDWNLDSTSLNKSSKLKSRQKIYWSFFPRPGKKLRSRFQTRQFIHWKNGLYLEPSFFNRPHIVWSKVHQISNG